MIDRTFRAGEKFRAVRTEARKMQFLYADGTDAHFMDTRVLRADRGPRADACRTRCGGRSRTTRSTSSSSTTQPGDLQLPASVELEVTQTEPGVRGDTASGGGNKPATLETGAPSRCRCS